MGDLCNEIQKLGKGIGNATRYRILESLMKGPRTVGDLVKAAKASQPAVSQHLKVLKSCELVKDEKQGQEVLYSLNTSHMLGLLTNFAKNMKKPQKVPLAKRRD
jgi:DNA-binding transcriptional ArsR family regulator